MSAKPVLDQIGHRLREASKVGGSIEAAQVKVIGLEEIRVAAGARWPRMRERVRNGSMSILSQHTGPDDVIVPAGDGYLIILAEGAPGDSQRRCQEMQDALLRFYLGEDALKSLRPDVCGHSLTTESLTSLITESLEADKAHQAAPAPSQPIGLVPMFVAHEKRIAASVCAPILTERGQRRIAYNPDFIVDGRHPQGLDFLDLDVALLDDALTHAAAPGKPRAIGLHVHASTMQHRKAREHYLAWMDQAPPEVRGRLFVTIAEIEKGAPLISLAEWSSALRQHVARVWLDFHYSDHAITSVSGSGAWAAGFQLPGAASSANPRGQRLLDQLTYWKRAMRNQNMRLFVHGFHDQAFFNEAAKLGVDFATSDTLWPFDLGHGAQRRAPVSHPNSAAIS
ncbi:MAG: hypothetical protein WDM79_18650 [Terricaulis sp.]